jgi:GTP-binding protein EngB required for normal cell division
MRVTNPEDGLNPSQKRHLLTSAQYADKLLSEIEAVLSAANSRSPFPKFKADIAAAQAKVVQDYVARLRDRMVRVLASQGIEPPPPAFGSIHSIRVTLAFVRIAFEECTPGRMRGYGAVPESKVQELNGVVGEMTAAVDKLNQYLAQGLGQDLQPRLERLERTGDEIGLLKRLERIIGEHGLVEFRPALSVILDRLESKAFEIALFGRVSSGKSSLLNAIVQADVLPVGVNPVTAVPTTLAYGPEPRLSVCFAGRSSEQLDISRLPEFVTEQLNPANARHVTRITVELPSARLRDGVVLVDTPGLGSLATAGAVETLAYLPRCDLGVVLIDAGSTLTEDDLGTIQALYDAGVPASVLLSKADLLAPEDRARALQYIAGHIQTRLGLNLPVHPVSVKQEHSSLLESWLEEEILPLYARHRQLAQESVRRKIGTLRESVETALKVRLERSEEASGGDVSSLRGVDARLRNAAGRFEEAREICWNIIDGLRSFGDAGLAAAASQLFEHWRQDSRTAADVRSIVAETLTQVAAEKARAAFGTLDALAKDLAQALQAAAQALNLQDVPAEGELSSVLKEMPRIDLGTLDVHLRPNIWVNVWEGLAKRRIEGRLRAQIGRAVAEAFYSYGRMLEAWTRRTLAELQRRFDTHADGYRAHLDRITAQGGATPAEKETMRRDLDSLMRPESRPEFADKAVS